MTMFNTKGRGLTRVNLHRNPIGGVSWEKSNAVYHGITVISILSC